MSNKLTGLEHLRQASQAAKGLIGEVAAAAAADIGRLDADKQDKITGAPGQVAGFNADGELAAQDAPGGDGTAAPIPTEKITALLQKYYKEG